MEAADQSTALAEPDRRTSQVIIEVDDDMWLGRLRERNSATALVDAVGEAPWILDGRTNGQREAVQPASPRASTIPAQSLCSAVATASNPDG